MAAMRQLKRSTRARKCTGAVMASPICTNIVMAPGVLVRRQATMVSTRVWTLLSVQPTTVSGSIGMEGLGKAGSLVTSPSSAPSICICDDFIC